MPDTLNNKRSIIDTVSIKGTVLINDTKAKDTLVTKTIQADKAPQNILENSGVKLLITIGLPLLIFWLGQRLTIYNKKRDRRTILEGSKHSLEIWILQLEESVNIFAKGCKMFVSDLQKQNSLDIVQLTIIHTLVDKVSDLKLEDYQSYTIRNIEGDLKTNAASSFYILQHIEYLKNTEATISELYKNYQDDITKIVNNFKAAIKEFHRLNLEVLHAVDSIKNHPAKKFSVELLNFIVLNDPSNMETWFQNFCKPMFKLITDELETNNPNQFPIRYAIILDELRSAYHEWNMQKENLSRDIDFFSNGYLQGYKELKEQILNLQEKELKKISQIK